MEFEEPRYQYPLEWINQTDGAARPAGIYLLDGRVCVAARHSAAEAELLRAGALYIATLVFGGDPFERARPGATVERVAPGLLVAWSAGATN